MKRKIKMLPGWVLGMSAAIAAGVFFPPACRGEDLTTLDGRTFANISTVTKYPKLVVFTCNGDRKSVQNTNLPQDFIDKYKLGVETNTLAVETNTLAVETNTPAAAAVTMQPGLSPDDRLLSANKNLFECDYYPREEASFVTNRFSRRIYRGRSWQICLIGTEVNLTYYGSEDVTNETTQSIHFLLGQESTIKQAFDKFVAWNQIATTNKTEPFEKQILQCPDPGNVLNNSGMHTFTFRWDATRYGGALFYDSSTFIGGFDMDSVTRFRELLEKLPDLKAKVLAKIQNRDAQKTLFK